MSENEHRGIRDLSQYDSMPTEALEQILRADAETPAEQESDIELILYVMEVLASRKRENQQSGKTAQQSWESFQQHYLPEQEIQKQNTKNPSGCPWLRRIAACAAVVILILCIPLSTRAFSLEELWDVVARWAKETFSFVSGDAEQVSEPSPTYDGEYTSLEDLLKRSNRPYDMVPTWIPDGFILEKVEKDIMPTKEIYVAIYRSENKAIRIKVQSYLDGDPEKFEIDDEPLEVYEDAGITYYIFSNQSQIRGSWISNCYECSVSGDLNIEELKQMIKSIEIKQNG